MFSLLIFLYLILKNYNPSHHWLINQSNLANALSAKPYQIYMYLGTDPVLIHALVT